MATRLIELILHGNAGQAIGEMEKLAATTGAAADTMHAKISNAAAKTTMAMAAMGIGIAAVSVKLADDFEKAHALLQTAVNNTGGSMQRLNPIIDSQETKFQHLGYTHTQYEQALARGVVGTGNAQKAIALMGQAADLAAFKHVDLETAMTAVTKASEGFLRPLKLLGIDLPIQGANAVQVAKAHDKLTAAQDKEYQALLKLEDAHGKKGPAAYGAYLKAQQAAEAAQEAFNQKAASGDQILQALHGKTMGAAQRQAETFAGKVKELQATLENLGIKIGQAIIPVIEKLASGLSDVIHWFDQNKTAAEALGIAIGTVLAAAVSIFVYDKVAAFVGGLQRMATGLGLMSTKVTAEAAPAFEQLTLGAQGTGVAAGGASTSLLGIVGPIALVAGAAYGLYTAFNEAGVSIDINSKKLATFSEGALGQSIVKLQDFANKWNDSTAANRAFNQILDKTPQFAQKWIDAADKAGVSTAGWSQKLREHTIAAEESKVAQERWTIQAEILDAKARGDTAAVYGLTLQLNALPSDKQIMIAVGGNAKNVLGDIGIALDQLPQSKTIDLNVVRHDTAGVGF